MQRHCLHDTIVTALLIELGSLETSPSYVASKAIAVTSSRSLAQGVPLGSVTCTARQ